MGYLEIVQALRDDPQNLGLMTVYADWFEENNLNEIAEELRAGRNRFDDMLHIRNPVSFVLTELTRLLHPFGITVNRQHPDPVGMHIVFIFDLSRKGRSTIRSDYRVSLRELAMVKNDRTRIGYMVTDVALMVIRNIFRANAE